MKRREFITLLGGAAAGWPLAARAQQSGKKMLRVGTVSALQQSSPTWAAFMRRMAELGYQEGKTFVFDLVSATSEEDYETGYRTLAAREPDIIMATGPESALKSALAVTRTLPIVMIAIDYDPFARGYVTNLARPSGNVTGVVFQQIDSSRMPFGTGRPRPCSGTACLRINGKQRGVPPPRWACSFLGLNCASCPMTMTRRSIRHRSIIATYS